MTLRVNRRRSTVDELQAKLAAAGLASTRMGDAGLVLETPRPVQLVPGFEHGCWSVQDAAAQQAAPLLLGPKPAKNLRVLDACAAPGGKTAHLLELADDASVLALDSDAERCQRIHDTLQRLGLMAEVRCADARQPDVWWDGQPFDAILLDAPCSGSGVVRRHPDIRWLRRASDIAQLAATQEALLHSLWPLLRPAGKLLYCTCSVFRAEGDMVIGAFLAHNTDARLLPSPGALLPPSATNGGDLPDNPHRAHDGFYYALLEKVARA
jgi:16S rRNA (cytosine967-C5)-methyltransferase